jgi:hypothetical protein
MTLRRTIAYSLFCSMDHLVWLMIQLLPDLVLLTLIERRPWRRFQFRLSRARKEVWFGRFSWLLTQRSRQVGRGSTCLSRSLSGRLLLDLIGINNQLHLGMCKFLDGRKVPHAWLTSGERLLTPGISPGVGVYLTGL